MSVKEVLVPLTNAREGVGRVEEVYDNKDMLGCWGGGERHKEGLKGDAKVSVVHKGEAGDGEVANGGNEGSTSEGIIHNNCTITVGPRSEQIETMKRRPFRIIRSEDLQS